MSLKTTLIAASLIAIIFFFALGAIAAGQDQTYKTTFSPTRPFSGVVRIRLQNNQLDPVLIYGSISTAGDRPLAFKIDGEDIIIEPQPVRDQLYGLAFIFRTPYQKSPQLRARVYSNEQEVNGSWSNPIELTTGVFVDVTDSLSLSTVGVVDTHTVEFTTTTTPLSDSGIVWIIFPSGFDASNIDHVIYQDNDSTNNDYEPTITAIDYDINAVLFHLSPESQQALPGSRITLRFWPVSNDTIAGDRTVWVLGARANGEIYNGPVESNPFTLMPGPFVHILVNPDTAIILNAGSFIHFSAVAQDQYGNTINGINFAYRLTVDSCGQVVDNNFRAIKLGQCYITAESDGLIDSTGLIIIIPGPLTQLSITGNPASIVAGTPFGSRDTITVTAYDGLNNIKYDYTGSIHFTTGNDIDDLPYRDDLHPYTFTSADSGKARFNPSSFVLKRSGITNIHVIDGPIGGITGAIRVMPAAINTFSMRIDSNATAGIPFSVEVANAIDLYNNLASGEIVVSDSIGGGQSPDGIQPTLNNINVTDGFGGSLQTLTNAIPTSLKGVAIQGNARAATDMFDVLPGAFGRFDIAGYPDVTIAGAAFPLNLRVYTYDIFGNLKRNYLGLVNFSSSDSVAVLPPPYQFIPGDSGWHEFSGSSFRLRTSGGMYISVSDGIIIKESNVITVNTAPIFAFNLQAPTDAVAGNSFIAQVSEARDSCGNYVNTTVIISDSIGGGGSPNGTLPVFSPITVTNGSGSAGQTLFNAVATTLKGDAGSLIRVTSPISVSSGVLGRFSFIVSSPQITGIPFFGSAGLTAYDRYGNLNTNFDASADNVTITSSSGGAMANNILNLQNDFTNGVSNLIPKGTTYLGIGGSMIFQAASQSGVTAVSGQVNVSAIICQAINIEQSILSIGDTATGRVDIRNLGDQVINVTDLLILDAIGNLPNPIVSPGLPYSLNAGETRAFNIRLPIPTGTAQGLHPLTASVRGNLLSYIFGDTLGGYPDTIFIGSPSMPVYVASSLRPDTALSGSNLSLSLRLLNPDTIGLTLLDSSYIHFGDGNHEFRSILSASIILPPAQPSGTQVRFDSALVSSDFPSGRYQASLNYYGLQNGHFRSGILVIPDSIAIQSPAALSYVAASLNIDSLVPGQMAAFSIQVQNNGTADFLVRHQFTKISFGTSPSEYIAYSDTNQAVRVDIIPTGITTFHFTPSTLSSSFIAGKYLPSITMSGTQNGIQETIVFNTSNSGTDDSVKVITPARVRIDSTYTLSMNAPFVNISQPCSLRVNYENLGDEAANSFYIQLSSDGSSEFVDSVLVTQVNGHERNSILFSGQAGAAPNSNEIFTSSITGGAGSLSGNPLSVIQPIDNIALLITEIPAHISLSDISIINPPEALDDTISFGQTVILSATVHNTGQADVNGLKRLVLVPPNGAWTADSLYRDFSFNHPVYWQITAPSVEQDSVTFSIQFQSQLTDANNGAQAIDPADSISTTWFTVVATPWIQHQAAITSPDGALDRVISTNQTFVITDTLTAHGLYSGKGVRLRLPVDFTTQDSLVKYPSGNIANWVVYTSSVAGIDTFNIACWVYDDNTGDSMSNASPIYIGVEVVRAASLRISSSIVGPPTAIDGIVEPGGELQFEAIVTNSGDASLMPGGQVVLRTSLTSSDNTIRDFTAGSPVDWVINLPDSEVPLPIPIAAVLYNVPADENNGLPANVIIDSSAVTILVRQLYPRLILNNLVEHSGSVVKGDELPFLTFDLQNSNIGGEFPIGMAGFAMTLECNPQLMAADLLSSISISSDSSIISSANFNGSKVVLSSPDTIYLAPSGSIRFTVNLGIKANTNVRDFSLKLQNDFVDAEVIENNYAAVRLYAVTSRGEPIAWQSEPTAVLEQSFAASLSCYPNPFNPRSGGAKIGYYLPSASNLDIKVFTLLGELVWTKTISSSDAYGTAGLHTGQTALSWDGKNDIGKEIRSGVYICIINNLTTGEEEKFKIAIVK
jgi:hypothetical protein